MGNRYDNKLIFKNEDESYESILEDRGIPYARYYGTTTMISPSPLQRSKLLRVRHIWKVGDKFYKLAIKHYDAAQYWWVIALYNQVPTESDLKVGDIVIIPLPLNEVLRVIRG